MRFLLSSLIVHAPHPVTGIQVSTAERFQDMIDKALLAEELGFDGFGVGERHERPFISSSPTVVLSHLAALTRQIRLFTTVTTLSLLDPVRAYEDYATLDHLSHGRLELIIGKGNGSAQRELFNVTPEDQWARNAESYEVFRALWRQDKVSAETRFRPPLHEAEVWPRPLQQPIRVWHGSATSRESVDLAAVRGSAVLRQRHQPDRAVRRADPVLPRALGALRARSGRAGGRCGHGRLSRPAPLAGRAEGLRAVFTGYLKMQARLGTEPVFPTLETSSSAVPR